LDPYSGISLCSIAVDFYTMSPFVEISDYAAHFTAKLVRLKVVATELVQPNGIQTRPENEQHRCLRMIHLWSETCSFEPDPRKT